MHGGRQGPERYNQQQVTDRREGHSGTAEKAPHHLNSTPHYSLPFNSSLHPCCCHVQPPSPHQKQLATPQQDPHTALTQNNIYNWIMFKKKENNLLSILVTACRNHTNSHMCIITVTLTMFVVSLRFSH